MFSKLALVFFSVVSAAVFVAAAPSQGLGLIPEDLVPLSGLTGMNTHGAGVPIRGSRIQQTPGGGSCDTGPIQCCNAVYDSQSTEANLLLVLLGVDVEPIGDMLAASCSPLTVRGIGSGSSCTSNAVCCSNNSFRGMIAVGCTPVNINF